MKRLTFYSTIPVLLVTMGNQGIAGWATFFLAPAARTVALALSLPHAWIGWQVGIVYGSTMLGCLYAGRVIQVIGAGRTLQLAMVLTIAGVVLSVVLSETSLALWGLFFGSTLIGGGYAFTNPACAEILKRLSGKSRGGFLFSLKQSSVPLGLMCAGLATPFCTQQWGWESSCLPIVLCALASIATTQRTEARFRHKPSKISKQRKAQLKTSRAQSLLSPFLGLKALWQTRSLFWLSMMSVTLSPLQMIVMGYTSTFATERLGYNLITAGLLLSVSQGATFFMRPLWGGLGDRFVGLRPMISLLAVSAGLFAGLLLLLPFEVPFFVAVAIFAPLAASAAGWNGIYMAEITHLRGNNSVGEATSSALFFTYAACFVGPFFFPLVIRWLGGYAQAFAAYGLLAMLGCLVCGLASSQNFSKIHKPH